MPPATPEESPAIPRTPSGSPAKSPTPLSTRSPFPSETPVPVNCYYFGSVPTDASTTCVEYNDSLQVDGAELVIYVSGSYTGEVPLRTVSNPGGSLVVYSDGDVTVKGGEGPLFGTVSRVTLNVEGILPALQSGPVDLGISELYLGAAWNQSKAIFNIDVTKLSLGFGSSAAYNAFWATKPSEEEIAPEITVTFDTPVDISFESAALHVYEKETGETIALQNERITVIVPANEPVVVVKGSINRALTIELDGVDQTVNLQEVTKVGDALPITIVAASAVSALVPADRLSENGYVVTSPASFTTGAKLTLTPAIPSDHALASVRYELQDIAPTGPLQVVIPATKSADVRLTNLNFSGVSSFEVTSSSGSGARLLLDATEYKTRVEGELFVQELAVATVKTPVEVKGVVVKGGGQLVIQTDLVFYTGVTVFNLTVKGDFPVDAVVQFTGSTGPAHLDLKEASGISVTDGGPGTSEENSITLIGARAPLWGNDETLVDKWKQKAGTPVIQRKNTTWLPYILVADTSSPIWGVALLQQPAQTPLGTPFPTGTGDSAAQGDGDPALSGGVVAAIVIAVIVFAAVIGGLAFYFVKKKGDADSSSSSESSNFSSSESEQDAI